MLMGGKLEPWFHFLRMWYEIGERYYRDESRKSLQRFEELQSEAWRRGVRMRHG